MMRVLGAILAGGRSSRFGSDKALAMLDGATLLERAVAAIAPQVEKVVICGREGGLPDRPGGGLGPLAGLNAGLHAAREEGFDAVLSLPCDTPHPPDDLLARLADAGAPAFLAQAPVIGLWPCDLADALDAHLAGADRSMRGWARAVGAVAVPLDETIVNVNTPADLAQLQRR